MAGAKVGLEVDGERVTVVEVVDGVAVAMRSVDVGDLAESASLALAGFDAGRRSGAMRVSLSTSSLTLRRIDVSAQMRAREAFEDAAFAAMPVERSTHAVAGSFFRPDLLSGQAVSPGVALVAPSDEVAQAYAAFAKRRVEVVSPCLTLRGFDGLWLGLRYSCTELALVLDDHVVAARQMRAGGLNAVAALLGDGDPAAGLDRLEQALAAPGRDVIADAELDRHFRTVASEVRQTVDFWERAGDQAGSRVLGFGPGALAHPMLAAALGEHEFQLAWPEALMKSMAYVQPAERPVALGAFLAALTCGDDLPQASFLDPAAAGAADRSRHRASRLRAAGLAVAALLLAVLSAGLPAWQSSKDLSAAREEVAQAQAQFDARAAAAAQLDSLQARSDVMAAATAGDPDWGRVTALVLDTAPEGSTVTQMTSGVEAGSVVVSLTADHPDGTYADLTGWMRDIEQAGGITWSPNFATREGTATYQLTFRLPLAEWVHVREVPAVPGSPALLGSGDGSPVEGAPASAEPGVLLDSGGDGAGLPAPPSPAPESQSAAPQQEGEQ